MSEARGDERQKKVKEAWQEAKSRGDEKVKENRVLSITLIKIENLELRIEGGLVR